MVRSILSRYSRSVLLSCTKASQVQNGAFSSLSKSFTRYSAATSKLSLTSASCTMSTSAASSSEPLTPMPFAVMQNCHVAIRGFIKDCETALEAADLELFRETFKDMTRAIETHVKLEDNGFFRLLDERFDNLAKENGLRDLHTEEESLTKSVQEAQNNANAIQAAFAAWKEHHLKHLKTEEDIMMPKVMEIAKSVKRDALQMGNLFQTEILGPNFDKDELAWFARWNVRTLSKHGSPANSGDTFTPMRVWLWGLQWSCTPEQWEAILPEVKEELMAHYPDFYERLRTEFDIESSGKAIVA